LLLLLVLLLLLRIFATCVCACTFRHSWRHDVGCRVTGGLLEYVCTSGLLSHKLFFILIAWSMSNFCNGLQTYNGLCRPVGLTLSLMEFLRMFVNNCIEIKLCAYCHYQTGFRSV
jgi:hypothetical protein